MTLLVMRLVYQPISAACAQQTGLLIKTAASANSFWFLYEFNTKTICYTVACHSTIQSQNGCGLRQYDLQVSGQVGAIVISRRA